MRRRAFISLLGGAAAAWPITARAQQGERKRRVGFLLALAESDPESQARIEAFRQGFESLGWTEGRNVSVEYRWHVGNPERLQASAAELVAMKPDVIFAGNTTALSALRRASGTVPMVFVQVLDPVAMGFVESFARPGGNITGFALYEYGIASKWLELLKDTAPHMVRVAVIYDPSNPTWRGHLRAVEGAVSLGVQLSFSPVRDREDIERTIDGIAGVPNSALIVLAGPLTATHRELIVARATTHRLPSAYPYRYFAAAGGLISYGPDTIDQYRRAAAYVDRILKGEKPADLPVQLPTRYSLIINLKTAKALGLDVPPTLLARADEVIE
jgi:putative ABC transport system substrate-binding protein